MKVGFYTRTSHLGNLSWEDVVDGEVGVSGTDYRNLDLIHQLSGRAVDVAVFKRGDGVEIPDSIDVQRVLSLSDAVAKAKDASVDILWFSNREDEDTKEGVIRSEQLALPCVVSSGIDLSLEMADLLYETDAVRRLVTVSVPQANLLRDQPVFEKTEAIHGNGLKPVFLEPVPASLTRDPERVGYLGALTRSKGFHHVAKAWPDVRSAVPGATLEVIGSAKLYNRNQRLGPLGIAEKSFEQTYIIPYLGSTQEELHKHGVTFHGLLTPREIRNILEKCAVGVVNPICKGSIETFCLSAVEVQACGCAVVSANRVGLRETARDGETGILLESEDQLSRVLIERLQSPEHTRQLGETGRRWVRETFVRETVADQWINLFMGVLNESPASPPCFSWSEADTRSIAKEFVRLTRKIPPFQNIPSLRELKSVLTSK